MTIRPSISGEIVNPGEEDSRVAMLPDECVHAAKGELGFEKRFVVAGKHDYRHFSPLRSERGQERAAVHCR